jgi:signal-transduction protein with cAMP-binding, CBS, and nucleotidyltransferase domain
MLVKEIMTPAEKIVIVAPMTTLRDAIKSMKSNNVRSLVVDKNGIAGAYGLLTYKNLLASVVAEEGDIDLLHVYDIATIPALSISGLVDIKYAARLMIQNSIKRLLVTKNNEIQGIVAMTDIMNVILDNVDNY